MYTGTQLKDLQKVVQNLTRTLLPSVRPAFYANDLIVDQVRMTDPLPEDH